MTMTDVPTRASDDDGAMGQVAFADLGLPPTILRRLGQQGLETPFPIQAAVIPDALAGRDVAGRAPTGSGKTLGFGLPVVAGLTDARRRRPVALVLAPTRELAEQITSDLAPFAEATGHRATAVYGGVGYGSQRTALERGCELVIACPGRLEDLISMGVVELGNVTTVVIDEADQMADMGFLPAVRRIVEQTAPRRQVLLFSATLDGPVAALVDDYQHDPVFHRVGPVGPDVLAADHRFWVLQRTERQATTAALVDRLGSSIVFTRTRHGADRLARQLARHGVTAEPIHGGRSQPQRDRALEAFKRGRASALVATDVAARGIHVSDVSVVIHYDPPADASTYLHRSGRTARAGASGTVVSLIDPTQKRTVRTMLRDIDMPAPFTAPDLADLGHSADSVADEPSDGRHRGTVKFFNASRGYGFILPDLGGADLFVHHTNVAATGPKVLDGDVRVRYVVAPGRNGPEAFEVEIVDR